MHVHGRIAVALSALACAATVLVSTPHDSKRLISRDVMNRLKPGMTLQEVQSVWGPSHDQDHFGYLGNLRHGIHIYKVTSTDWLILDFRRDRTGRHPGENVLHGAKWHKVEDSGSAQGDTTTDRWHEYSGSTRLEAQADLDNDEMLRAEARRFFEDPLSP